MRKYTLELCLICLVAGLWGGWCLQYVVPERVTVVERYRTETIEIDRSGYTPAQRDKLESLEAIERKMAAMRLPVVTGKPAPVDQLAQLIKEIE